MAKSLKRKGTMSIENTRNQLDNIKKCADTYSASTGIPLELINSEGDTLYHTCNDRCSLCKRAGAILKERLNCRQAHLYGSYQAERWGGKYVFFCQLGLTHWVSPVVLDENEKGALIAGPVLMVSPDEFLLEEIWLQNLSNEQVEDLKQTIGTVPVVESDKVDHLSNLLFIVSAHASGKGDSYLSDTREILEQQASISNYIHYIKTMGGQEEPGESYPLEKENELRGLIASGDKAGAKNVLNEILGSIFFKSGGSFEIIRARVLELIVVLSRAALEGGADVEQIFGLNYRYINEIHKFKTIEEITSWLSKIMVRFSDCVFEIKNVKHADVIYKALDYIRKNYMRKISLEDVASVVYLSPSYFSKIFKEGTGSNFVTYLNNYRIRVSKRLLLDETIDLVDVSNLVGYDDQSYFSKMFKKVTGVSPGKFRENRGHIKPNN